MHLKKANLFLLSGTVENQVNKVMKQFYHILSRSSTMEFYRVHDIE